MDVTNFSGHWYWPEGRMKSEFDFVIERVESIDGINVLIEGVITERLGYARFSGSMSDQEITFTKIYSEETLRKTIAAKGEIYYKGKRVNNKFIGTYRVIEGESHISGEGTFEMQETQ